MKAKAPKVTSPLSNTSPEATETDLRRDFMIALSDLVRGPKINASGLEVVRKFLADCQSDRRWEVEQVLMPSAPQGSEGDTPAHGPGSASLPPAVAAALPFAAPTKAIEAVPSGPEEDTRSFANVSPRLSEADLPFLAS